MSGWSNSKVSYPTTSTSTRLLVSSSKNGETFKVSVGADKCRKILKIRLHFVEPLLYTTILFDGFVSKYGLFCCELSFFTLFDHVQ